ncbi:uncharacterized protein LOC133093845 isoform X1 [Eubalaena glacialis]|uniref:uncharacterized protein LOC133093845 isoform X1 n=1 Tax=Eubalaena glacialis TaxID=27606 RepID=UPI002A5A5232|nr:uncharacterized protein LOC133093845 isoform X1 [Eubalaena glacialis]
MCACARVRLRSLIPFWGDNSEESSCYQSEKEAHLFLDHETEQCWLNPPCVSWMFMTSLAVSVGKKWIYLERYTFHRQNEVHLKRREQPGRNTFHGVGHLRRTFFREGVQRLPQHGHPHQEPWTQRTFSFPLASASNTALFSRRLWGCFSWNLIPCFTGNQHQAGRRVALPSRPRWQSPCGGKGQRLGQHGGQVPGEQMKG